MQIDNLSTELLVLNSTNLACKEEWQEDKSLQNKKQTVVLSASGQVMLEGQ